MKGEERSILARNGLDEGHLIIAQFNVVDLQVLLHVLQARGSRQRRHTHLHGEAKDHLLRMDTEPCGDRHDIRMAKNWRIRRQQRKPLVHDFVRPADLTDLPVPTAICETPVLHYHRFDFRLFHHASELSRVDIADSDHAGAARFVNLFCTKRDSRGTPSEASASSASPTNASS